MAVLPVLQTERQWIACNEPEALLALLTGKISDRKLRLFAVSCCRHIWELLTDPRSRLAVEVAAQFADGQTNLAELTVAGACAQDVVDAQSRRHGFPWRTAHSGEWEPLVQAAQAAWSCCWSSAPHAARGTARAAARAGWSATPAGEPRALERRHQCDLLRDITGNPFRPIQLSPVWLTDTVRVIARTISAEGRHEDLPILGDALEDAGCTDEQILAHCHSQLPHVPGCWVVDSVLGRT